MRCVWTSGFHLSPERPPNRLGEPPESVGRAIYPAIAHSARNDHCDAVAGNPLANLG